MDMAGYVDWEKNSVKDQEMGGDDGIEDMIELETPLPAKQIMMSEIDLEKVLDISKEHIESGKKLEGG